jgi:hypothetical protein
MLVVCIWASSLLGCGGGGKGGVSPGRPQDDPVISVEKAFYIRQGATGANDGSDWANAWTDLPKSLQRGACYYVAAGTYGSHVFNDEETGSKVIMIKKATPSMIMGRKPVGRTLLPMVSPFLQQRQVRYLRFGVAITSSMDRPGKANLVMALDFIIPSMVRGMVPDQLLRLPITKRRDIFDSNILKSRDTAATGRLIKKRKHDCCI